MLPRRLDASLLADLWFFHAVAAAGGFRRAAAQLSISQGAVSQRMLRLEGRLGLVLMQRGPRGFVLTAAGEQLYAAAQQGFAALGQGLAAVQTGAITLRLVAPPSLALGWLLPRLGQFSRRYPDISVDLQADTLPPQPPADPLQLRLCYLPQPPQTGVPHWPEYGFPVLSPAARQAGAGLALLHDDSPWGTSSAPGSEWARWLAAHGRPVCCGPAERHFNQAQLAYRSAQAGEGVALGRQRLVAAALQEGSLCRCDDAPPLLLGYYALYGGQGDAAAALAAWLAAELAVDPAAGS